MGKKKLKSSRVIVDTFVFMEAIYQERISSNESPTDLMNLLAVRMQEIEKEHETSEAPRRVTWLEIAIGNIIYGAPYWAVVYYKLLAS